MRLLLTEFDACIKLKTGILINVFFFIDYFCGAFQQNAESFSGRDDVNSSATTEDRD